MFCSICMWLFKFHYKVPVILLKYSKVIVLQYHIIQYSVWHDNHVPVYKSTTYFLYKWYC